MVRNSQSGNRRKKKTSAKGTLIFGGVLVILAVIFLITAGGSVFKSSAKNQEIIGQNVKVLKELEEKTPASQGGNQPSGGIEDLPDEEEKVLNLSAADYDVAKGKSWFQGAVLLGDSVAEAAAEFDYLSREVDLAVIGANLLSCDEQIEGAIARYPSVVFLCFGANDFEIYDSDYDSYIKQYKVRIDELKAALPDAVFYLEAPFPVQAEFRDSSPGSHHQPEYVQALKEFCEKEENVYCIDATFLLDRMPELYEPDGIHPVASFYPKWLTYMADVTGLSKAGDEDE